MHRAGPLDAACYIYRVSDSTLKPEVGTADRSLITKWRERFRYGLFMQECLDRFNRLGILFYPYYVIKEHVVDVRDADVPPFITFAEIERDGASLVANLPCRLWDVQNVVRRMEQAK